MSTTTRDRGSQSGVTGQGPRLASFSRSVPRANVTRGPRRSWGSVTLAALLVVVTGLAVAAWGLHAGQKVSVVTVRGDVVAGHVIERADLTSTAVAGVSGAIPLSEIDSVVGKTARVSLLAGQVITSAAVVAEPLPGPGEALVGLSLDSSRAPALGLAAGDHVDVVVVPGLQQEGATNPDGSEPSALDLPEVLADGAYVLSSQGEPTAGGQLQVTVVVPSDTAARIAAYSTQNRLAVVETAADATAGAAASEDPVSVP